MRDFWKASVFVLAVTGTVCSFPSSPNRTCSLCPAGTFVKHKCDVDADTQCLPCDAETFSATADHMEKCIPCSECPEGMYVDRPCQIIVDTVCSPCSSAPRVDSDYFLASCEGGKVEITRIDLNHTMMSDGPGEPSANHSEHAGTSATQADGADHVEKERDNKDIGSEYTHSEGGDEMKDTKEIPHDASTLPVKDSELHTDPADKTTNASGQIINGTNSVDTDEAQNTTDLENKKNETAVLMPLPIDDQASEHNTDFTLLSTHENSSLDEGRLASVKLNDDVEESDMKREMDDLHNQTTFIPRNEDVSEARLSENAVSNHSGGMVNNTDRNLCEGTQSDAPIKHVPTLEELELEAALLEKLSDNKTDHHPGNSSVAAADQFPSEKANSAKVVNEDTKGKKRAAIILGVAIASLAFFTLVFFASRCWKSRRGKFKEMKKVDSYDKEAAELQPLSYSDTGSHEDPEAQATNGLYRQGPPLGPSTHRKNQAEEEKLKPTEIQVTPETSVAIPVLTVSPAADDLSESLSDHEPLVSEVGKLKYIDESTDDEYVMAILNKIPFSRLSHVVEEPSFSHPTAQQT